MNETFQRVLRVSCEGTLSHAATGARVAYTCGSLAYDSTGVVCDLVLDRTHGTQCPGLRRLCRIRRSVLPNDYTAVCRLPTLAHIHGPITSRNKASQSWPCMIGHFPQTEGRICSLCGRNACIVHQLCVKFMQRTTTLYNGVY